MCNSIYPLGGRENYLAGSYCEMAMEAYYSVIKNHAIIIEKKSWVDSSDERDQLEKSVVACLVFSVMCIEAYLNDYAAACLGDSEFYDNFDKLSVLAKLELICQFILRNQLDKSRETYRNLKSLLKDRNVFVHSKSSCYVFPERSVEELSELEKYWEEKEVDIEEPLIDLGFLEKLITKAENALKTIYGIALHFDKYDTTANAIIHLFRPIQLCYLSPKRTEPYRVAFRLLGIKEPPSAKNEKG